MELTGVNAVIKPYTYVRITKKNGESRIVYVHRVEGNKIYFWDSETRAMVSTSMNEVVYIPPRQLTIEESRKIIRYEITLSELLGDENVLSNTVFNSDYHVSFSDIKAMLDKVVREHIDDGTFCKEWFFPLYFDLLNNCWVADFGKINTITSGKAFIARIMYMLEDKFEYDEDISLCKIARLAGEYEKELAKPEHERKYPVEIMQEYVSKMDNAPSMKLATDEELYYFRKFALALSEVNNQTGLLAVANGAYGGNRAFKCDWELARQILHKLLEITDEHPDSAYYANSLGYIYYYGRCNGGEPQYDEAYKYFSMAAFGGVYEAHYKIADMYKNGYGVAKKESIAQQIISMTYEENIGYIAKGRYDCKFADIALRKSEFCTDDMDRLYYCMQAAFAIKMRMLDNEYYGDTAVEEKIETALSEIKSRINYIPKKSVKYRDLETVLRAVLQNGAQWCEASVKKLKGGRYKFVFRLSDECRAEETARMFLTIPEIDFCGMTDKLSVTFKPDCDFEIEEGKYTFNGVGYDGLWLGNRCVCPLPEGEYHIRAKKKDNLQPLHFVTVVFPYSSRTYNYLCKNPVFETGDKVIANNKVATVVNVIERYESELALPLKKYKKISGRA